MNDGGPAFPGIGEWQREDIGNGHYRRYQESLPGMSLLDYFAGEALKVLLAKATSHEGMGYRTGIAYDYAECMLAERERRCK